MSSRSLAAVLLTAALTGAVFTGCSRSNPAVSAKAEKGRSVAPDFTLKDAGGNPVKLSDFRGKVVLLNFWATWCGPCKIEIPWFIDFQQSYKDKGLAVVGVSLDDDGWKSVKPYVDDHKINYRVLIGTEELSQLYGGVDALPTTFLIDRDGRIAMKHEGLISKGEYQDEIQDLLNGKSLPNRAAVSFGVPAFLWAK